MLFPNFSFRKNKGLTEDFVTNILGLDYATTFITPRTGLSDFFMLGDVEEFQAKIYERYGVDVSDIEDGNLLMIIRRIAKAK